MGKLLILEKLVAVSMLKKIRIKQRLLAEKEKTIEKIFLETMNIAAKQRCSACSECARLQLIKKETEIAALVPNNGCLTNKGKTKGMAARRKLKNLRIKRKLEEEEKRKLEEEEKRKLEEEKIEMFNQTILWRLSGFY